MGRTAVRRTRGLAYDRCMPFVQRRRTDDEEAGDAQGLSMDLGERACVTCRRSLHPWQDHCPDDGGEGLAIADLPPMSRPPAHLLADLEAEDDLGA